MKQSFVTKVEELSIYAGLEGTELGEFCEYLVDIAYSSGCASDDFLKAIESEVDYQLKIFKENTEIIEVTEHITRNVKKLEWL